MLLALLPPTPPQVYTIIDEMFLGGEIQETSKPVILTRVAHLEQLSA